MKYFKWFLIWTLSISVPAIINGLLFGYCSADTVPGIFYPEKMETIISICIYLLPLFAILFMLGYKREKECIIMLPVSIIFLPLTSLMIGLLLPFSGSVIIILGSILYQSTLISVNLSNLEIILMLIVLVLILFIGYKLGRKYSKRKSKVI